MTKFGERDFLIVLRTKIDIMSKQESSILLKKSKKVPHRQTRKHGFPFAGD